MFALVHDGLVWELSEDRNIWIADADVRDLGSNDQGVEVGWIAKEDGGFDTPPSAPDPVPVSITRAQAKIQLRRAGLRDQVEALIAKADPEVQDWYAEAGAWFRDNSNVAAMAKQLKLKGADVDQLFRDASQIAA